MIKMNELQKRIVSIELEEYFRTLHEAVEETKSRIAANNDETVRTRRRTIRVLFEFIDQDFVKHGTYEKLINYFEDVYRTTGNLTGEDVTNIIKEVTTK